MLIFGGLSIGFLCVSGALLMAAIACAIARFAIFMREGEWPRMTVCTMYRFANSPPHTTYAMLQDSRCSYEFSMRGLNVILGRLFDDTALLSFLLLAVVVFYALSWGVIALYSNVRNS